MKRGGRALALMIVAAINTLSASQPMPRRGAETHGGTVRCRRVPVAGRPTAWQVA
jgi:hypothetical protein